jgi:chemotaxis protein MotB
VLTTIALVLVLGLSSWIKAQQLTEIRLQLEDARAAAAEAQAKAAEAKSQLDEAEGKIDTLAKEKDSALENRKTLEDQMRASLESKDVTISRLQGKLTVNILDRVLFDSGEADLRPEGEGILRKVAGFLTEHPEVKVHVIGHTDNVPIRTSARNRFASNWELSTARATAAVRFLSEKAGVNATRLGAVGYGEFRPIADNTTPEGRAKNRRIAITLLPDELAGADLVPVPPTDSLAPQHQHMISSPEPEERQELPQTAPVDEAESVKDSMTSEDR